MNVSSPRSPWPCSVPYANPFLRVRASSSSTRKTTRAGCSDQKPKWRARAATVAPPSISASAARRLGGRETELARARGARGSGFDFRVRPAEAHPAEVEHLPVPQSFDGFVENRPAVAEPDTAVIGGVAGGRRPELLADLRVGDTRRSGGTF